MSAHTPGPWQQETDGEATDRTHYVVGRDGLVRVADVLRDIGVSVAERNANKRLIAAAPELLDALRALVACADPHRDREEIRAARAAIAKAAA